MSAKLGLLRCAIIEGRVMVQPNWRLSKIFKWADRYPYVKHAAIDGITVCAGARMARVGACTACQHLRLFQLFPE